MKNIVAGTIVSLTFPLFEGGYRNATYVRDIKIEQAVCLFETYGKGGKHWFTFEILESADPAFPPGARKRLQGKNAYAAAEILAQPADEHEKTESKRLRKFCATF